MNAPAGRGYQPDQASARIAGLSLLGVLALGVLGALVALGAYLAFAAHTVRPPVTALERTPMAAPGPRLETDPRRDRLAREAAASHRLETYGWVDRPGGRAHVPIERAMVLRAQRGWPDAEGPSP